MSVASEPSGAGEVPVAWYVMGAGDSGPAGLAVEPGEAGVDIPDDVLEWAEANGVDPDDPDVYMLVTTEANPGGLSGARGWRDGTVSASDGARIDEARAQDEAWDRERRGRRP
jgi:hypothetical protein